MALLSFNPLIACTKNNKIRSKKVVHFTPEAPNACTLFVFRIPLQHKCKSIEGGYKTDRQNTFWSG